MVFLMALTSFMSIGLNPVVAAERSDSQTELVEMVVKDKLGKNQGFVEDKRQAKT